MELWNLIRRVLKTVRTKCTAIPILRYAMLVILNALSVLGARITNARNVTRIK